jgi:acetolactate synthase regulatory subunit
MPAYRLAVHADPLADGLLRILGVLAVQPIGIVSVRHDQTARRSSTVLEIVAEEPARVERLAARLAAAPWARDVQVSASGAPVERSGLEMEVADAA